MSNGASTERSLGEDGEPILAMLLDEALQQDGSVDAPRFRANHYEKIVEIERLDSAGYIKCANGRYFVTASALTRLNTETARRVLSNAERMYGQVREHYRATQAQKVEIAELAREAGIPLGEARTALTFMLDNTLWCGGWSTNLAEPTAHVIPAEGCLKYPTFKAAVEQVREWRSQQHASALTLPTSAALASSPDLPPWEIMRHQIPQPDWLSALQEPLRGVMSEVYRGVDLDLRALAAMGIRAVIDMVLVDLVGDVGGFDKKLDRLVVKGHLTEASRTHMLAAIDAGNAAAHRGHIPDRIDVHTLLRICENLLYEHLVMPSQTHRLQMNTPVRPKPGRLAP